MASAFDLGRRKGFEADTLNLYALIELAASLALTLIVFMCG
jgi:hypothetical protein